MTDSQHGDEQFTEEANIESLGARLRAAREHKGLTIDSVAHQLNLSQQRVLDMENDEYRFSNAETYAKGYLRSYAKLLGLDPDQLVQDFDRMHYTDTIERHETKLILKRQVSSSDRWMRWITYSIGILLIFLVAIWWRSQPNSPAETEALVSDAGEHSSIKIEARERPQAQGADASESFAQELGKEPGAMGETVSIPSAGQATTTHSEGIEPSNQKNSSQSSAVEETSSAKKPVKDEASDDAATQKSAKEQSSAEPLTQKKVQASDQTAAPMSVKNPPTTADATQKPAADHDATKGTVKSSTKAPVADSDDTEDEEDDSPATLQKHSRNNTQHKLNSVSMSLKSEPQPREPQSLQRQLEKEFSKG